MTEEFGITVGQLKKALSTVPDDTPIKFWLGSSNEEMFLTEFWMNKNDNEYNMEFLFDNV